MMNLLKKHWPLAFILAFGASLMAYNIGEWSFWFDESYSSMLIRYDYWEIAQRTANDVHPPLYYWLLKAWSGLFGTTDAALRSFSAVGMLVSAVIIYPLINKMANSRIALASALTIVAGPYVVRYAQEARMYALAAVFLSVASLALYSQMQRKKKQRINALWIVYALSIAAAMYTHYFTAPIVVTHLLYVLLVDTRLSLTEMILSLRNPLKLAKKVNRQWVISMLGAGGLFMFWLPVFIRQTLRVGGGFWIQPVSIRTIPDTMSHIFLYDHVSSSYSGLRIIASIAAAVAVISGAVWLWRKVTRKEKASLVLLVGPAVISALILITVSLVPFVSSIYYIRYMTYFVPLLYAAVPYVVWLIWRRASHRIAIATGLVLAVSMVFGTYQVVTLGDRSWGVANQAIEKLEGVIVPGDEVVAVDFWRFYDARHYLDRDFTIRMILSDDRMGAENLLFDNPQIEIDSYDDVKPSTGTIWFLSSPGDADDESLLPEEWQEVEIFYEYNGFKITRYTSN